VAKLFLSRVDVDELFLCGRRGCQGRLFDDAGVSCLLHRMTTMLIRGPLVGMSNTMSTRCRCRCGWYEMDSSILFVMAAGLCFDRFTCKGG